MSHHIEYLTKKLTPLVSEVINHPLYMNISSIDDLKIFMEEHVFAVWDFMCLLKELHRRIVSTTAPWFPPKDALTAHLINSILVEEEGDVTEDGDYASHYDIYLSAMDNIGADTGPIKKLLLLLVNGQSIKSAIDSVTAKKRTKKFVLTTFDFFNKSVHEIAAAFVYGREGLTSPMFTPLLDQLQQHIGNGQAQCGTLAYYLKRHITLDDGEHFPKALKMLDNLIGNDEKKLQEAEQAAIIALNARIEFLSGIHASLNEKRVVSMSGMCQRK